MWGDAQPANIMVEGKKDNAILIDFGGGYSPDYINFELYEKREGDLQALDRILAFIDNLDVAVNAQCRRQASRGND